MILLLLVFGGALLLGWQPTGSDAGAVPSRTTTQLPTTTRLPTTTQSPTVTEVTSTTHAAGSTSAQSCDISPGEPFVGGPSSDVVQLGESNGARVEGVVYPRPDYAGNPWSQWGQGLVLPDGRFLSAIGDHHGRNGNSFIYEFDPKTGVLSTIGDVLSYVDHEAGSWGYGKIHGQMVPGPCGEVYMSTYWGTAQGLDFDGSYGGDLLLRIDPYGRTLASLGVPIDFHGQPSLATASSAGLIYGEALDPLQKANGSEQGPFFAYDVRSQEVVFVGPSTPHEGFRAVMVDGDGRAYYSIGGSELAVYDPNADRLETHPHRLPGDWLRATTLVGPDGRVFGVTREPDAFFVFQPTGQIEEIGEPPGYTTSLALSPDGRFFYYMPGAHGDAWRFGGALISVDTDTGGQQVVAELNHLVENGLGLTLGGSYNVAIGAGGDVIYVGANAGPRGDDSGFGEVVLLVVHLP